MSPQVYPLDSQVCCVACAMFLASAQHSNAVDFGLVRTVLSGGSVAGLAIQKHEVETKEVVRAPKCVFCCIRVF